MSVHICGCATGASGVVVDANGFNRSVTNDDTAVVMDSTTSGSLRFCRRRGLGCGRLRHRDGVVNLHRNVNDRRSARPLDACRLFDTRIGRVDRVGRFGRRPGLLILGLLIVRSGLLDARRPMVVAARLGAFAFIVALAGLLVIVADGLFAMSTLFVVVGLLVVRLDGIGVGITDVGRRFVSRFSDVRVSVSHHWDSPIQTKLCRLHPPPLHRLRWRGPPRRSPPPIPPQPECPHPTTSRFCLTCRLPF